MKRLKQVKKGNTPTKSKYQNLSQYSGSKVFLEDINKRKRGFKSPSKLIRHYGGLFKKLFVLSFILGSIYFFYRSVVTKRYFDFTYIEITGAHTFVNYDDLRLVVAENLKDQNYFTFNELSLENTLYSGFLGAKSIRITKRFPSHLIINIEERVPLAILYNSENQDSFLVDNDGYILGVVADEFRQLPKVLYSDEIHVGDIVKKDIVQISIQIIESAKEYNIEIDDIDFKDKYILVKVWDGVEVKIKKDSLIKDVFTVIYALRNQTLEEGKKLSKIDLRYDKVIVIYDNSEGVF